MTSQEKILREEIDEVLKDHDGVYLTEGEKRYITLMEGNTTNSTRNKKCGRSCPYECVGQNTTVAGQ
jgi:hypothetical protein